LTQTCGFMQSSPIPNMETDVEKFQKTSKLRRKACASTQVLSEVTGVSYSQYGVKDTIPHLNAILSYPIEVYVVRSDTVRTAAEYARDYGILPYDDIHIASAIEHDAQNTLSADQDLDKIDLIIRIDPLEYKRENNQR